MNPGELGPRLAERFPGSGIIAVFNGVEPQDVPELEAPFQAIWSEKGLRSVLEAGYDQYIRNGDGPLVRTDSDEHPMDCFEGLAKRAVETDGLVVGNLVYYDETMPPQSLDALAQLIWGEMYGQASRGKAPVGNAHGLLVFSSPAVCQRVLEAAKPILARADEANGGPVQWGHDGLMILAAVVAGIQVEVFPIMGTEVRNRNVAKIFDQFKRHFSIVEAAIRTYPDQLG